MNETTREKIEGILGNFDNLAAGHNKIYHLKTLSQRSNRRVKTVRSTSINS